MTPSFPVAEYPRTAYSGSGATKQMVEDAKVPDAKIHGRAIFISYRRDDTEGETGRLYDDLVRAYGDDSVFMDVAGIDAGMDFRKAIDANVSGCGVLLAIIGPTWASITGDDGARRLDHADDYVRLEIATALARNVPVIPVLVHAAHMPPLDQLPDDLKDLRYRNSVELTHARWNSDVALLIGALKNYVTVNTASQTQTVHATVPVQLPAPQPAPPAEPAKKSQLPLFAAVGAVIAIALAGAIFTALHYGPSAKPLPSPQNNGGTSPAPVPSPANPQPTPAGDDSALLGKWKNSKDAGRGDDLEHITIADFGGQLMVEAWGKCEDRPCNWGSKKATMKGHTALTESWDLRNSPQETKQQRSVTLSIEPSATGIQVTVQNTFHMPNGRTVQNLNPLGFVKMP